MASLLNIHSDNGEQTTARPRIVLISMEENEEQFFTAVRSGISAYLLKDGPARSHVPATELPIPFLAEARRRLSLGA